MEVRQDPFFSPKGVEKCPEKCPRKCPESNCHGKQFPCSPESPKTGEDFVLAPKRVAAQVRRTRDSDNNVRKPAVSRRRALFVDDGSPKKKQFPQDGKLH